MAIIQRDGEEGLVPLRGDEALDILLANCEDAYGFPPYPVIQRVAAQPQRLGPERQRAPDHPAALSGKPTHLLRSQHRNRDSMLPALVTKTVGAANGISTTMASTWHRRRHRAWRARQGTATINRRRASSAPGAPPGIGTSADGSGAAKPCAARRNT